MRKAVIALVVVAFIAYCVSADKRYTRVNVPAYETVEIDLLGGRTRAAWNDDKTFQEEHIEELAGHRYQPMPGGLKIPAGEGFSGRTVPADESLDHDAVAALIAGRLATTDGPLKPLQVRNPSALYALEQRRVSLRNKVDLNGETLAPGTAVTKPVIDKMIAADVKEIGIVGTGEAVSIEFGTMAMVILIFLGLNAALMDVLWLPLLKLIDEREAEIKEGSGLVRKNREDAERVEEEGRQLHAEARREYLAKLNATQREAQMEADKILNEAKVEARLARDKARKELRGVLEETKQELTGQVPELAAEMAEQVLGRPAGKS